MNDFTMFYGAASGSSKKALKRMGEENIMISTTTKASGWNVGTLFVDCGAYSTIRSGKELPKADEYAKSVVDMGADIATLRDLPCEPGVLDDVGRSVGEQQQASIESQLETAEAFDDHGVDAERVAVVQGWNDPREYLENLDELRDYGLVTDRVGVGSVCRRGSQTDIRHILHTLADEVGDGRLHSFGVKTNALTPTLMSRLASSDTSAIDYIRRDYTDCSLKGWKATALGYLRLKQTIETLREKDENQLSLQSATGGP